MTLSLTLVLATPAFSQVFMDADSTGDAYARILSKGYGYEVPDCIHPIRHILEEWDNVLRKNVFVFSAHTGIDNDRCINFDRQRTEIKTWSQSPDSMNGFFGETLTLRWKFKLDAAFQPSANFTHIHQIKAGDGTYDTDMPLITITPVKASTNKMEVRFTAPIQEGGNTTKIITIALAPLLGEWVEAYETMKFDSNGHGSYSLQLKKLSDDSPLLSYTDSTLSMWRRGISFCRPKYGIYRSLLDSTSLRDEAVRFADFYLKKGTTFSVPPTPGGVSAVAVSEHQINLSWTVPSHNVRIDRSLNGSTWSYLATARAGTTAFSDTGLTPVTRYYYHIRSENTFGNSPYSATAAATTGGIMTLAVALTAGWNLIANPVQNPVPGDSVVQLYPTSATPYAFEFNGAYVQSSTLVNGKGYWAKFPDAIAQPVSGNALTIDSINVIAGWNIVGTISCTVDTDSIVSVPAGLKASSWFGYADGYTSVTQLEPGKAYWIKTHGPGKIVLRCESR